MWVKWWVEYGWLGVSTCLRDVRRALAAKRTYRISFPPFYPSTCIQPFLKGQLISLTLEIDDLYKMCFKKTFPLGLTGINPCSRRLEYLWRSFMLFSILGGIRWIFRRYWLQLDRFSKLFAGKFFNHNFSVWFHVGSFLRNVECIFRLLD